MAKHDHTGGKEPRSYGQTHHEQSNINLNTASAEELARLPMVGPTRANDVVRNRPYRNWEDLEKIPGISKGMIDDLKSGGARID
jgi:DNA uptake protein ComE-like DNA-binding protein